MTCLIENISAICMIKMGGSILPCTQIIEVVLSYVHPFVLPFKFCSWESTDQNLIRISLLCNFAIRVISYILGSYKYVRSSLYIYKCIYSLFLSFPLPFALSSVLSNATRYKRLGLFPFNSIRLFRILADNWQI